MTGSYESLPANLPEPIDDGACDHLIGMSLPDISLPATTGGEVNLFRQAGTIVVYIYPMTGRPGVALPQGWDDILVRGAVHRKAVLTVMPISRLERRVRTVFMACLHKIPPGRVSWLAVFTCRFRC